MQPLERVRLITRRLVSYQRVEMGTGNLVYSEGGRQGGHEKRSWLPSEYSAATRGSFKNEVGFLLGSHPFSLFLFLHPFESSRRLSAGRLNREKLWSDVTHETTRKKGSSCVFRGQGVKFERLFGYNLLPRRAWAWMAGDSRAGDDGGLGGVAK